MTGLDGVDLEKMESTGSRSPAPSMDSGLRDLERGERDRSSEVRLEVWEAVAEFTDVCEDATDCMLDDPVEEEGDIAAEDRADCRASVMRALALATRARARQGRRCSGVGCELTDT